MIGRVAGKRVILWVMTIARVSCWAGELLENVWFCELWLLSVWVTELASCWKTCDFVSYDFWACELLSWRVVGKRVILWVLTIELVSYWGGELLENVWFCELWLLSVWVTERVGCWKSIILWVMTIERVSYWSGELCGKLLISWVMTIEHISYWAGGLLGNVWFCELWLLSIWVTERVGCWKTCDFASYDYSACELLSGWVVGNSGVPRNFVRGGGFNKFSWGQRTEKTGIWGR